MKSLAKLSLLLALVVAGRYLRPTAAPVARPTAVVPAPVQPDNLEFASFTTDPEVPLTPVSHRILPAAHRITPDSLAWF